VAGHGGGGGGVKGHTLSRRLQEGRDGENDRRYREGEREGERARKGTSRIVRLRCDVQLAEDYYFSKWRRNGRDTEGGRRSGKENERGKERERERERKETTKSEEAGRKGGEGNVTSSIMVQLLLCITYSR